MDNVRGLRKSSSIITLSILQILAVESNALLYFKTPLVIQLQAPCAPAIHSLSWDSRELLFAAAFSRPIVSVGLSILSTAVVPPAGGPEMWEVKLAGELPRSAQ